MAAKRRIVLNDEPHDLEIEEREGTLHARLDEGAWERVRLDAAGLEDEGLYVLFIGDRPYTLAASPQPDGYEITLAGRIYRTVTEHRRRRGRSGHEPAVDEAGGELAIKSTMAGVVVDIFVKPGDTVEQGQALLVVEAMKMQNEMHAPRGGTVAAVHVGKGDRVDRGTLLLALH